MLHFKVLQKNFIYTYQQKPACHLMKVNDDFEGECKKCGDLLLRTCELLLFQIHTMSFGYVVIASHSHATY